MLDIFENADVFDNNNKVLNMLVLRSQVVYKFKLVG